MEYWLTFKKVMELAETRRIISDVGIKVNLKSCASESRGANMETAGSLFHDSKFHIPQHVALAIIKQRPTSRMRKRNSTIKDYSL